MLQVLDPFQNLWAKIQINRKSLKVNTPLYICTHAAAIQISFRLVSIAGWPDFQSTIFSKISGLLSPRVTVGAQACNGLPPGKAGQRNGILAVAE